MPQFDDDLEGIGDVEKTATWARRFIAVIGAIVAAAFTFLQLREMELGPLVERTTPDLLLRGALIFYYLCWIAGTTFDVKIQQKTYIADPERGRLSFETFLIVIGFFIVAAILIWARNDERRFAPVLAVFVLVNIVGWRHIVKRMAPAVIASRAKFMRREDYFRLEQVTLVDQYMKGEWQRCRFAVMLIVVVLVNLMTFSETVREGTGLFLGSLSADLAGGNTAKLLPSALILLFVAISEIWIWTKRIFVWLGLSLIDNLRRKYTLSRRFV